MESRKNVKDKQKRESYIKESYIEGIGRRKSAVARVRIYPNTMKPMENLEKEGPFGVSLAQIQSVDVKINDFLIADYFKIARCAETAIAPFFVLSTMFKTTVVVQGGGVSAQADATRLGLARALQKFNEKWRVPLKARGYLTRDARVVERKRPGYRKARKPQQWSKR